MSFCCPRFWAVYFQNTFLKSPRAQVVVCVHLQAGGTKGERDCATDTLPRDVELHHLEGWG